ncbi:non-ribosomal peptide synthetase [uncultured Kordia sp.]|uniref:non-ribosomal peptide synthetase n=1 Tax=uncultured Kordia sp. TaxID=507699 RepID=UPI00260DED28|nr:non-ribosomal peptide synthetase [uncultured Kordia sp.]
MPESDHLVFIAHHLIIDGVSWRILLEDFTNVYSSFVAGEKIQLPAKTTSYKAWAKEQQAYVDSGQLEAEQKYWSSVCELPSSSYLPETLATITQIQLDSTTDFALTASQTEKLQSSIHVGYNTNVNDILLSSLSLSLDEVFSIDRCLIELEGHGREELTSAIDLSRTVGWFTSLYPFELQSKGTNVDTLITTKEGLRNIPNRGIGYSMLQYLSEDFKTGYRPLLLFNYLGDFGSGVESTETTTTEASTSFEYGSYDVGNDRSKNNISHVGLEVTGIIVSGELSISIRYSQAHYTTNQIKQLEQSYKKHLQQYIQTLSDKKEASLTPSDLSYSAVSIEELSQLTTETAIADIYELSPLQEGMYYHWLSSELNELYFEQMSYSVNSLEIPIPYVKAAYNELIARYEVLRTGFRNDIGGTPLQIVHKDVQGDFRYYEAASSEISIEELKQQDRKEGFDLSASSLMRLQIYKTEKGSYEFLWSHHHILIDGWCMSILINDFYELIRSKVSGKPADLPKVLPYSRYINWLRGIDKQSSLNYWNNILSGYEGITRLPMDKQAVSEEYQQSHIDLEISQEIYTSLKAVCAEYGFTQNTLIQGVWSYLLSRYTQRNDVVYGSVVSGRPSDLEGVETMVGLFINTIPVRVELNEEDTVTSVLKRIQEGTISSNGHHYLNLSEIQSFTKTGRHLIDHILMFGNYLVEESRVSEVASAEESDTVEMEVSSFESYERTNYNFYIQVAPDASLSFRFVYNEALYSTEYIQRLSENFNTLLTSFVTKPEAQLSKLAYVSPEEESLLLNTYASDDTNYTTEGTILDRFEEIATQYPTHTAVVFEGETLSYQELDEQSNQLAHYLRSEHNIGTEDLVGILLDRSQWMIVSILGILKTGAAYVPIDPNYPEARKEYILEETKAKLLITSTDYMFDIYYFEETIFAIDVEIDFLEMSPQKLDVHIAEESLAYILYTSGSTGKPKGGMITHKAALNTALAEKETFQISEKERCLQFASFSFDASVWESFLALLSGASLYITTEDVRKNPERLLSYMLENEITVATLPPSYLRLIEVSKLRTLNILITAGEQINYEDIAGFETIGTYYNAYGLTETSICSSIHKVAVEAYQQTGPISIGNPIRNMSYYVLQDDILCPIGVAGELCISGIGLAKGYHNNEQLTAEKFVENPFVAGERMYKTGDLVRWLSDGTIEFLGRIDDQVKLRGYRIELGAIENSLINHKEIRESVVLVRELAGQQELIGYYVSDNELETAELRSHVGTNLPQYMLPSYFVHLKQMPLTANGKIAKKELPNPEIITSSETASFRAAETDLEKQVVAIWEEILGREHIGLDDDFFVLGGHSLRATRLLNKYHKEFEIRLELSDLFSATTVASQVELLSSSANESYEEIPELEAQEDYAVSSGQHRLWILSQFKEGSLAYHMPSFVYLEGNHNVVNFQKAVHAVVERHEILRTVFKQQSSGEVRQRIIPKENYNFTIDVEDFSSHENSETAFENYRKQDAQLAFDLENGPLFRCSLIQLSDKHYAFYYNLHHIISDGWSMDVLRNDVMKYYQQYQQGLATNLEPLRIQYKDYSQWQLQQSESEIQKSAQSYWKEKYQGELPILNLPVTKLRPKVKTYNGRVLESIISNDTYNAVQNFVSEHGGSTFMVLLSSWQAIFYRYSGLRDQIIGTPTSGRMHKELENQIGFYINTLALRNTLEEGDTYVTFYERVTQNTLESFNHQAYPFDRLVEDLALNYDTSRSALFDVLLTLNQVDEASEEIENTETIIEAGQTMTKFDIEISFHETEGQLSYVFIYNEDVYDKVVMKQLMKHYEELLSKIVVDSVTNIDHITYLNNAEKEAFVENIVSLETEDNLLSNFQANVAKTPENIAVIFDEITLTYQELDRLSNQFAHYLINTYQVASEELIALKLERTEWMIISILGVLKSGAAYVPIDPNYPQERITYIEADINCKVSIDEAELTKFRENQHTYAQTAVPVSIAANNLAYVIYTSGSTGKPKGVMIAHKNAVSMLQWAQKEFAKTAFDVMYYVTSYCFDLSIYEMFYPLSTGKSIRMLENGLEIPNYLETDKNIAINTVPSVIETLISQQVNWENVVTINMAGEPIPQHVSNALPFDRIEVRNLYGPSEDTTYSSCYRIEKTFDFDAIPIGKPIDQTHFYILSEEMQLQPDYVEGELYIEGAGLAKGYLNKEALTQERFIPNPFKRGTLLYKTGDIVRRLQDGNIVYRRRSDHQIKLRGYRIELGEIEQVIQKFSAINQVVTVVKQLNNEPSLTAYITSDDTIDKALLRSFISERLPEYMVPSFYMQLDELPRNANGKIDRKNLPEIDDSAIVRNVYVAPESEVQKKLVTLWEELLAVDKIGIEDDFFELGGNSIKAMQLITNVQELFQVTIDIANVFLNPNITQLATEIEKSLWYQDSFDEDEIIDSEII